MLARNSPGPGPHADNTRNLAANVLRNRNWINSTRLLLLSAVTIFVVVSFGSITVRSARHSPLSASLAESASEDNLDQRLAHAATAALGERRGTIIVMDPQTGRVRAVVNSQIAFEENLPPGSTIKPFTALAALRSGLIDENSDALPGKVFARRI